MNIFRSYLITLTGERVRENGIWYEKYQDKVERNQRNTSILLKGNGACHQGVRILKKSTQ